MGISVRILRGVTVATCVVAAVTAPTASAGGRPFELAMSGAQEFSPTGVPINPHGDADSGSITLTLNPGQEEVCWSVGALSLTAGEALPHVAHIHIAPPGVAGPVVIDLFGTATTPPPPTSYPTGTTCVAAERSTLIAIMQDPSAYYVNLHNAQHPAGVTRAQLG